MLCASSGARGTDHWNYLENIFEVVPFIIDRASETCLTSDTVHSFSKT